MSGERLRVLIADDNPVDRQILSAIVRKAGYDLTEAVDGNDAIEKFRLEKPDLLLLDAIMPGKDGFQVAEEIKGSIADEFTPIIFLTSLTDDSELARCLEAGGDDFLTKPYSQIILKAKLQAMSRMRELHQTMQVQRDEISKLHKQMVADEYAAKAVFDNIAHSRQIECDYIRHLLSPMSVFNGDVLLAALTPAGQLYAMLGDFTGHGLAAAVGAMPLADCFYSMVAKGFSLREVLRECNQKLGSVLPSGYFCCAVAVNIDFNRCTVEYWNGGVPTAYLKRCGNSEIVPLISSHLPLGILNNDKFRDETRLLEARPNDRLFFATDGVVEARNSGQEYFGEERLLALIEDSHPDALFDTVKDQVYDFMNGRDDDITMVEIKLVRPDEVEQIVQSGALDNDSGPKDWKLSYELGPDSLRCFNPLPMLQQVVLQAPHLRKKSTEIYTVLAELYSNALEHGVLGLDSNLKASVDGFTQYYEARAHALAHTDGCVRLEINGSITNGVVNLVISVTDSGAGFDFQRMQAAAGDQVADSQYHGRGVRLLQNLCQQVEFVEPGNQVCVTMTWREDSE